MQGLTIGCAIKEVAQEFSYQAAVQAVLENPANAVRAVASALMPDVDPPERLVVKTNKYWGPKGVDLTVSFLDNPNEATKKKILDYANLWGKHGNIKFRLTARDGQIRIARETDGYWSYLGTDITQIALGKATMNLQGFTERTSDAEYLRVVVHEFGHSLGFPHEHSRPDIISALDERKTIAYFKRTQGWSESTTRSQILTSLNEATLMGSTKAEAGSIMCYDFAGECTKNGRPIIGGKDLTQTDKETVAKLYPVVVTPPPPPVGGRKKQVVLQADGETWEGELTLRI